LLAAGGIRKFALQRTRRLTNPADAGVVIEALEDTDRDVRTAAEAALGPLLAAVGPETSLQLSPDQYKILLASLLAAPESLAMSMLAALRVIGDSRADSTLAALAEAPDVPRSVQEAARTTRNAIAARGAIPSPYVASDPAVVEVMRADAPTVLSDILSADPGRQAEAIALARQLDPSDLGRVIDGLRSPVRHLKLRIALQAGFAVLLPMAIQAADWFSLTTDAQRWFSVANNLPFDLFVAGFLAYPLLGVRARLRRLTRCCSALGETKAAIVDEGGLEIPLLLDALRSGDMAVRARTLQRLRALDSDALTAVTEGLAALSGRIRRCMRLRTLVAVVLPLALFAAEEASLYGTPMWRYWTNHVQGMGFWAAVGGMLAWPLLRYAREWRQIVSTYALIDAPCSCGGLMTASLEGDADLRNRVLAALERLLPRVTQSDLDDLTDRQVRVLESLLMSKKPDTVVAALRALASAGNRRSLTRMEALASEPGVRTGGPDVARVAADSVRILRERLDAAASHGALLRPSAARSTGDGLLRPAAGASFSGEETLLRGTSAPQVAETQASIRAPLPTGTSTADTMKARFNMSPPLATEVQEIRTGSALSDQAP
jgi:hypothetical protein